MVEIWKDIPEYEGKYQVSNMGNVKSLSYNHTKKEKILKQQSLIIKCKNRDYILKRVALCKNNKNTKYLVHRLVWLSFHGEIPCNMEIDHIDNNPQNNKLENLQCITSSQNNKKRFIDNPNLAKTYTNRFYKTNPPIKIRCKNNGKIYQSISQCAKDLGLFHQNINKVLNGKYKHTGGYTFQVLQ